MYFAAAVALLGYEKMTNSKPDHTHTAWAFQRLGRKSGTLLEVGTGRIDADRNIAHFYMNRQPIGGYTGYVVLAPIGVKPPAVSQVEPQRPGDQRGDEDAQG
jgi:hypothetical protein